MGTRFHIGAKQLRSTLAAYAKRFDLLEVHMDQVGPRATAPASRTALRRWRKQVSPHFEFCVVGSSSLARLKPQESVDEELAEMVEVGAALEARVMLLSTPPEVTPASVWRDRLARAMDKLPRDATSLVWEPHGVWELEDAALQARKMGAVLAVDPSRDAVPAGPVAYTRLRSLGETRSYGPSALQRVIDAIGQRRDAYVVLETDGALAECKTLRRLAQSRRKSGDAGRVVVRPRFRVRDDEQE